MEGPVGIRVINRSAMPNISGFKIDKNRYIMGRILNNIR